MLELVLPLTLVMYVVVNLLDVQDMGVNVQMVVVVMYGLTLVMNVILRVKQVVKELVLVKLVVMYLVEW